MPFRWLSMRNSWHWRSSSPLLFCFLRRKTSAALPDFSSYHGSSVPDRFFCTTVPSSTAAFAEFFRDKCGFSEAETLGIVNRRHVFLKTNSTEVAEEVVKFLTDFGFTPIQVRKCILKYPPILSRSVDVDLKPCFQGLASIGFSPEDTADFFYWGSRSFSAKFAETLPRRVQYLQTLSGGNAAFSKMVKSCWSVLYMRTDKCEKTVECLEKLRIPCQWFPYLLTRVPRALCYRPAYLESRIADVKSLEMDLEIPSKSFIRILAVVILMHGLEVIQERFRILGVFGLTNEEILQVFMKQPEFVVRLPDKLKGTMDFIVTEAAMPANIVVKYPCILGYSLEKRIRPRFQVLRYLHEMKHLKPGSKLMPQFILSNKRFMEIHVNSSPYKETLLDICKMQMQV